MLDARSMLVVLVTACGDGLALGVAVGVAVEVPVAVAVGVVVVVVVAGVAVLVGVLVFEGTFVPVELGFTVAVAMVGKPGAVLVGVLGVGVGLVPPLALSPASPGTIARIGSVAAWGRSGSMPAKIVRNTPNSAHPGRTQREAATSWPSLSDWRMCESGTLLLRMGAVLLVSQLTLRPEPCLAIRIGGPRSGGVHPSRAAPRRSHPLARARRFANRGWRDAAPPSVD